MMSLRDDDLFEAFCIMTVDGHISDEKAIEWLELFTTEEEIKRLRERIEHLQ